MKHLSGYGFGKFVEISQADIHLSLYRGFLKISHKSELLGKVPLDDILGIVITGYGCSHSSNILSALAERNIPVSICNSGFSPTALVLPLVGNCRQKIRIQSQVSAGCALKKRLWKKIVKLKLENQACVLKENGLPYQSLWHMSKKVKAGDPENLEAQGARRYWKILFSKNFKRDKNGSGLNGMLNYAYAIIRSCVARSIVSVGLHPGIGIHHQNTYNPLCLVDDLMEPFRPLGDYVVKQLFLEGCAEVDTEVKKTLAKIVIVDIDGKSGTRPLFQVISRFVYSLSMVLAGEAKDWRADWSINWNHLKLDALSTIQLSHSA